MRFKIGPDIVRVRVCEGQLLEDGEPVDAIWHGGDILICGLLHCRRRLKPLLDQLRKLHEANFDAPLSDRGIASFTADMMRQLQSQGGEPALMRLTHEGSDAGGVEDLGSDTPGAECALCGGKFTHLQITTGAPQLDPRIGKLVVKRFLECEFCSITQIWSEGATPAGSPNGRVTDGPEFLKPHRRTP